VTERRYDPISGEWRTFATHRQERTYHPPPGRCPLCPTRDPAHPTEVPWPEFDVVVFDNRFPSFQSAPPPPSVTGFGPFAVQPATGAAEVVVYSDDHFATLSSLGQERIRLLVDVWAQRYAALGARDDVRYVFVFENRGAEVGVTLDHPHGQIYGYPDLPPVVARELSSARAHQKNHRGCVMCDVVGLEAGDRVRVVADTGAFLAYVPFAARFPYEVHVVAQRHAPALIDLGDPERDSMAEILHRVVAAYDRLFGFPLPYVMSMHQAPPDDGEWQDVSHLHVEFTPIHRRADRLKYLAGSEVGAGEFLNDVAPEEAAAALRAAARS
jgi:UDPglucose--hexose-1-phosphate uridylyltransferase